MNNKRVNQLSNSSIDVENRISTERSSTNPKLSEITGYSKDKLLNMTGWDFTRSEDRIKLQKRMKDRLAGKPQKKYYDLIIARKDGTEVPVEIVH
jgi:PAS domain S-box-containing protein